MLGRGTSGGPSSTRAEGAASRLSTGGSGTTVVTDAGQEVTVSQFVAQLGSYIYPKHLLERERGGCRKLVDLNSSCANVLCDFGRRGGAAEAGRLAPEAEAAGAADGDAGGRGRQSQQRRRRHYHGHLRLVSSLDASV